MKVSYIFSALAAATAATAFPFLSPNGNNDLQGLIGKLKSYDPANIARLTSEIKKGMEQAGADVPKTSLLNMNFKDINEGKIYEIFGLQRDRQTATDGNTHEANGGQVDTNGTVPTNTTITARQLSNLLGFGPAEDEAHPWQAPGPGDLRGPCPGLNTAANHGYLPRNGVVNPVELFVGTYQALALGPDVCAVLAVLAFLFKGDLTTLTLSIGTKHGLGDGIAAHGVLEGDASVTRMDAHLGNQWVLDKGFFDQFVKESGDNVTPQSLAQSRYRTWSYSRKNNARFDFNPWRSLVAYSESAFVMENLRGDNKLFTPDMAYHWFVLERFPPGWAKRKVPMTVPEILAWAFYINGLKPTVPGWSLGIKGLFIPLPVSGSLGEFFKSLSGGGSGTIKDVGCAISGSVLGWFPSTLGNIFGEIGIGKLNGLGC